jgi:hypothetical protein
MDCFWSWAESIYAHGKFLHCYLYDWNNLGNGHSYRDVLELRPAVIVEVVIILPIAVV